MKHGRKVGLVMLVAVILLLAGCGASPKSRADDLITYMPDEIGEWELDDTAKLRESTVSNKGHVILTYEGPDDAIAYIVIEVYPTDDAAEVAATDRERTFLLQGFELDSDRAPRQATATITQAGRARYALFHESDFVIEINTLAPNDETPVSDDAFGELLAIVRAALERVID